MVNLCPWPQWPSNRYSLPEKLPGKKEAKEKQRAPRVSTRGGKPTGPISASTGDHRKDPANYCHGGSVDGISKGKKERIEIDRGHFEKRSRSIAAGPSANTN